MVSYSKLLVQVFFNNPMYVLRVLVVSFCTFGIYTHILLLHLSDIKPNLQELVSGSKIFEISFRKPNIALYLISIIFLIKNWNRSNNFSDENTVPGIFFTNLSWKITNGIQF